MSEPSETGMITRTRQSCRKSYFIKVAGIVGLVCLWWKIITYTVQKEADTFSTLFKIMCIATTRWSPDIAERDEGTVGRMQRPDWEISCVWQHHTTGLRGWIGESRRVLHKEGVNQDTYLWTIWMPGEAFINKGQEALCSPHIGVSAHHQEGCLTLQWNEQEETVLSGYMWIQLGRGLSLTGGWSSRFDSTDVIPEAPDINPGIVKIWLSSIILPNGVFMSGGCGTIPITTTIYGRYP